MKPRAPKTHTRSALALMAIAATLALAAPSLAGGNKFDWTKGGNKAVLLWQSFLDDAAYMTVTGTARQLRGERRMYVKVDFYALRCSAGMNTCYTTGIGGAVTLNSAEGAEWQFVGSDRQPSMPKGRSQMRIKASAPLDPDATLMQTRVHICYDRNVTPDPCSRPRYGTLKYNSGERAAS